ncbi:hypothetical protein D3C80_1689490 [compost metagenome]
MPLARVLEPMMPTRSAPSGLAALTATMAVAAVRMSVMRLPSTSAASAMVRWSNSEIR